jgi:iron-sulfur cluster repair protein YtfE (RIC family)
MYLSCASTLERALMDHVYIHALVRRLDHELEDADPSPEILLQIAGKLEHHIRFEEKVLFPLVQERAGETALQSISLTPRQRARAS